MTLVSWHLDRTLGSLRIRGGFTSRLGGVSRGQWEGLNLGPHVHDDALAVARNRELLAAELGVEPAWMEQVHGAHVVHAEEPITYRATDGLWIGESDLRECADGSFRAAACVMTADCVPLLLVGTAEPVAAAVHVGRAGLLAGIAPAAIRQLATPVTAIIGPAICGACYEVPEQMRADAAALVPACEATTRWGTPSIDVPAGLRSQLAELAAEGLVADVVDTQACTFEDEGLYSHRRATKNGQHTGRLAGVVLIEKIA